ncbi:MAG: hypothetical protein P0Y53_23325 [Candidatus Pseudobacter hemicellulosilyticus]|uniref:Uncharacterized protein n=1 Tax=Candidatus Pseudobacter hemicellulosilyticus TaxID=3121375 RepID=A0AAJ6BH12_9BACT|nr:MAG: hypothetical protein P0Y53_23325 [Pseudobacter sp.]
MAPKKLLVTSLIRDDLTNAKLLFNLHQMGLNTSDYYLQLSDAILHLMGFKNDNYADEVYQEYRHLSEIVLHQELSSFNKSLNATADKLYNHLSQKSPNKKSCC